MTSLRRQPLFLGLILVGIGCSFLDSLTERRPRTPTPAPSDTPSLTETGAPPTPTLPAATLDFGDAPDPTYFSLLASDGARAGVGSFWLGFLNSPPTSEGDAKVIDLDEKDDGLIRLVFVPGRMLVTFQAVLAEEAAPRTAYFNLLADLDADGVWRTSSGEWMVANREVSLRPGESTSLEAEVPVDDGKPSPWLRATLTDSPAPGPDWDGRGLFEEGEVEDYPSEPGPFGDDWNVECDPEPLWLEHGDTATMNLVVVSGTGQPEAFSVVDILGPIGLFPDPFGDEIRVTQFPPDLFGWSNFPGGIDVDSLAVHGPPHSKSYTITLKAEGPGRVDTEDCLVDVLHDVAFPPFHIGSDLVHYTGPGEVRTGGILEASFRVTDRRGRPRQGRFFGTLGEPPGDPRASHANGNLDSDGSIHFRLPVNWPPGMTSLYFSWMDQVHRIAEIEVLP